MILESVMSNQPSVCFLLCVLSLVIPTKEESVNYSLGEGKPSALRHTTIHESSVQRSLVPRDDKGETV